MNLKSKSVGKVQGDEMTHNDLMHKRYFLFMTEFFAGMAVMAVELSASRLLAPYFSSSQIVWTIIIGTIMIAMALGNYWGGRLADAHPEPDFLYRNLVIASLWIAAIPVVGKYLIVGLSGVLMMAVNVHFLTIAAFLSCFILFVFPLLLLGTVTPSLAKYTMNNLGEAGRTVGLLGAFNTIGSIIGTFLPTFLTIPAFGTAMTFILFSGLLLVIAAIYFVFNGGNRRKIIGAAAVFLFCTFLGSGDSFAFWRDDLVYEGESVYNYLQVRDEGDSRILTTNVLFGVQSIMPKNGGLTGMYYDYALAAPVAAASQSEGKPLKILVLGMGTGTFAMQCHRCFPQVEVIGVEIDEKIIDLSHEYFALSNDVPVINYDGRAFLTSSSEKYDVIFVDAYQDITIPFYMSSKEFFEIVKEHLAPNGVMAVNLNMHANQKGSINEALCDTIRAVFPDVMSVDVRYGTNREVFASSGDFTAQLRVGTAALENPSLASLMSEIGNNMSAWPAGQNVLTDDKAPVEILGMQAMNGLINDGIKSYQDMLRKEGIEGVLNQLK